ncbi:MAG: hypothetical protein GTO24_01940 [candidate division Zixibacteria bacterium]|nr:hypothetical protein [candidate division Zixibacteria bacterium]
MTSSEMAFAQPDRNPSSEDAVLSETTVNFLMIEKWGLWGNISTGYSDPYTYCAKEAQPQIQPTLVVNR